MLTLGSTAFQAGMQVSKAQAPVMSAWGDLLKQGTGFATDVAKQAMTARLESEKLKLQAKLAPKSDIVTQPIVIPGQPIRPPEQAPVVVPIQQEAQSHNLLMIGGVVLVLAALLFIGKKR